MDNLDYLNKIAAKPAPTTGKGFLSPTVVKLLVCAAAALALIIALGIIISAATARTTALYEGYYLRLEALSSESGPIATYARDLKSSELRALAGTLKNSLTVAKQNFSGVLPELKVDLAAISQTASDSEANALALYTEELHDAKLNGILDRTFASSTALQISLVLATATQVIDKTSSETVKSIIRESMDDLETLLDLFTEFNNKSN